MFTGAALKAAFYLSLKLIYVILCGILYAPLLYNISLPVYNMRTTNFVRRRIYWIIRRKRAEW